MPEGTMPGPATTPALFDRLPPEILGSLTVRQKNALAAAADGRPWQRHRVNIRITLPLPGRRWYFTLVGGPERRSGARRKAERRRHPLSTVGNVAFVFLTAVLLYGVAVGALLFSSHILEY